MIENEVFSSMTKVFEYNKDFLDLQSTVIDSATSVTSMASNFVPILNGTVLIDTNVTNKSEYRSTVTVKLFNNDTGRLLDTFTNQLEGSTTRRVSGVATVGACFNYRIEITAGYESDITVSVTTAVKDKLSYYVRGD